MDISNLPQPPPVSLEEYGGKWIAWDNKHTRILASGRTLAETMEAARRAGENDPIMQKVPKANVSFCSRL